MVNSEVESKSVYLLIFTESSHIVGGYSSLEEAKRIKLKLTQEMMCAARDKMVAEYATNTDHGKSETITHDIKMIEKSIEMSNKTGCDYYVIGPKTISPYRIMCLPFNPPVENVRDSFKFGFVFNY